MTEGVTTATRTCRPCAKTGVRGEASLSSKAGAKSWRLQGPAGAEDGQAQARQRAGQVARWGGGGGWRGGAGPQAVAALTEGLHRTRSRKIKTKLCTSNEVMDFTVM